MSQPPTGRLVRSWVAVAMAVSVVHYLDNYVNYDQYPQGDVAGVPPPSAGLVAASWFGFTAFGIAALVLHARRRWTGSALCLAMYAGSGLIGVGHYLTPGATDMVWWRQAHVVADIACGVALTVLAARIGRDGVRSPGTLPDRRPARS